MTTSPEICGHPVTVTGRISRIVRLRDEYHDFVQNPDEFLAALGSQRHLHGNLFTFIQRVPDRTPRFPYHLEWDAAAVLQLSTYDNWWKKQINDKTRNMVRKAHKAGIEIRDVEFSDELVEGIARIYNETPIRQGRRFKHFGKSLATIKQEHATFLDRSDFIGAYHKGELVGFIKLVHGEGVSNLMQIISMISRRDKAPTNALIAKAVERCASRGVPFLHYGTWSRRSMGDFKKHHAFERLAIPRYYVPLNFFGSMLLRAGLHRNLIEKVPVSWLDQLASWRSKWNSFRRRDPKTGGAVAQMAERRAQA
ncbi:MAG TPA: hypothetical protein VIS99_09435 [Terrimicrobiaceae bacterium]